MKIQYDADVGALYIELKSLEPGTADAGAEDVEIVDYH
jgi:hypothetical protein